MVPIISGSHLLNSIDKVEHLYHYQADSPYPGMTAIMVQKLGKAQ